MGQTSDPYQNEDDDSLGITISGLPDEPELPEDVVNAGPEEPEGAFDAEAVELAAGDTVLVEGTGLDTALTDDEGRPVGDADLDEEVAAALGANGDDEDEDDADGTPVGDEVAYDLAEWEDDQLSLLFDKLTDAGIDYLWDGEELYVREEDEDATDVLIEQVSYPDQLDEEEDDGDAGAQLLGDVYIAADRLQHNPEDHESIASLLTLADTIEESAAPYGIADPEWKNIREKVDALARLLEAKTIDTDASADAARTLRNAIRAYV
ncbi:MAG TPA: hypothetical protein VIL36_15910 [Acidimicrobiales bacterium]